MIPRVSLLFLLGAIPLTFSALAIPTQPLLARERSDSLQLYPRMSQMNDMSHHGKPILEQPDLSPEEREHWEAYNVTTFLNHPRGNKSALYTHMSLIAISFIILYPITLVLNNAKSALYLLGLTIHYVVIIVALLNLAVYGASAPNLYPNNAYSKLSWALLFLGLIHYTSAILKTVSNWAKQHDSNNMDCSDIEFTPLQTMNVETAVMDRDDEHDMNSNELNRTDSAMSTLYGDHPNLANDIDLEQYHMHSRDSSIDTMTANQNRGKAFKLQEKFIYKLMKNQTIAKIITHTSTISNALFNILNVPLAMFGFGYILTGIATVTLMGQQKKVFNLLAHFIKGGVFFWYGVFSLLRYCGAFQNRGWAWNRYAIEEKSKLTVKKSKFNILISKIKNFLLPEGMISVEFIESFLIFFYGSTNIWMEHLGNEDGVWRPRDLQHASIAFMYFGCGLCGILTESKLSNWRKRAYFSEGHIELNSRNERSIKSCTIGFSPNPFPAFTVFWTGVLMSQHEQMYKLSTMIHMQWGYMLSIGAIVRLSSIILMFIKTPNADGSPSRPFTELVVSFCLICGGLVFMESNGQTVEALIYKGLDAMFSLNVSVGIVALIMAWIMTLMSLKDKLTSYNNI